MFKWGIDCDARGIKGKSASDPTLMWGRSDGNETIWGLCVCICLILSIRNSSSNKQAFCPPIYLRTDQDVLDVTHNSFRHSVSMNVCTPTNWLTERTEHILHDIHYVLICRLVLCTCNSTTAPVKFEPQQQSQVVHVRCVTIDLFCIRQFSYFAVFLSWTYLTHRSYVFILKFSS